MNWLMAHRVAGIAATNLRGRLDLPEDQYIDAFLALKRCGLAAMGQEMPGLFGAYLPPGPSRHSGILLNSTMSEATQRHTAAHELGHAEMEHDRCLADNLDSFTPSNSRLWPDEEKQAEAFAAWFLMPIRLAKATLTRLGLDIPREAADVYQLSLHLGTSYRGTLRHLVNLKLVTPGVAKGWAAVQPARLRARLCGERQDVPARVWDLTGLTEGSRLPVETGDRLLVRAPWLGRDPEFTGPEGVTMRTNPGTVAAGDGIEFDIDGAIDTESTLTATSRNGREAWTVTLMPTPAGHKGLIANAHAPRLVGVKTAGRR